MELWLAFLLAAAAILKGWTGVGLLLFAVLVAVTLLVELFKDNKLQDWLERCVWGNGPAPRYGSSEEEMAELKKALAQKPMEYTGLVQKFRAFLFRGPGGTNGSNDPLRASLVPKAD